MENEPFIGYCYIMENNETTQDTEENAGLKSSDLDPFLFFAIMIGLLTVKSEYTVDSEE
jgi:hypothetical protein